jgi:predicted restriction endonuclease
MSMMAKRERDRAYYVRNRKLILERERVRRFARREQIKAAYHLRKQQDPEWWAKTQAQIRARHYRRKKNPDWWERRKEEAREWVRAHPDKKKVRDQCRRMRLAGNGGTFTEAEWREAKRRYNHRCLKCGKRVKLTPDHVVPVSKGGRGDIGNIQPLCQPCNSGKRNLHATDYRLSPHPNCLPR